VKALFKSIGRGLLTHWKALSILMGSAVAIVIVVNLAYFGFSHKSEACTACHYMKPYYAQWKASTHKGVACIRCHPYSLPFFTLTTLKYWTDTYNPRPRAEVKDESCLQSGCHDARLLSGKVNFKGDIAFDHQDHLTKTKRGKRLRCTSCHSQIVQGEHIAVTERVCFLCHFKGARQGQSLTGCPSCHGTPMKVVEHEGFVFSHESYLKVGVACDQCHLDVTQGQGEVPEERCYWCHVERTEKYADTELVHDVHVHQHAIDCFKCHEDIEHGEVRMIRALEVQCENCHSKLHSMEKEMYMGTGGKDVEDTPSRMFSAQVACDGCHTRLVGKGAPEFRESTREAQRKSCVTCHGPNYDRMLDDWIAAMKNLTASFKPRLDQAKLAVANASKSGRKVSKEKVLLDEAIFNYDFVVQGKGVHNVEYAVKLIKSAEAKLHEVFKSLNVRSAGPLANPLIATPDGYCQILCHNRLGLPKQVAYDRMSFPHQLHARDIGLECTRCHSPEKHKMQIITTSECMSCHHEQLDLACERCHYAQKELYAGDVKAYDVTPRADVMSDAGIDCQGCHSDLSADRPTFEKVKEACVGCHDESYGRMLIDWHNALQEVASKVQLLLSQVEETLKTVRGRPENLKQARRLYEEGKRNHDIVEKGNGIHNRVLASELLAQSQAKLEKALGMLSMARGSR